MNILTFDIEEWFHLLDFDATRTESEWDKYDVRIYENVDRILDILEATNTQATFFIIGWIAKKYPDVVKKISSKYQIGSHTMNHQLVWQQSPQEFRTDVESSIKLLQDITGGPIECFRAPGFSIRESESWAFDILANLGIKYDCSIFPSHHAHGGMPSYGVARPSVVKHGRNEIMEFPVSTKIIFGKNIIYSGGGYFRLIPYYFLRKWTREALDRNLVPIKSKNNSLDGYTLAYIHPRDLDAGQPMLKGLPLRRRFKSYIGLNGASKKLSRYLWDFKFIDIQTATLKIDWGNVPIIEL